MPDNLPGFLDVLSVGHGHMTFDFEKDDPIETARAAQVVQDMLKRGYALFIEGKGGKLTRVKKFNPKTNSYIIATGPDPNLQESTDAPSNTTKTPGRKIGQAKKATEVPIRRARATAIAPTAGG